MKTIQSYPSEEIKDFLCQKFFGFSQLSNQGGRSTFFTIYHIQRGFNTSEFQRENSDGAQKPKEEVLT